MPLLKNLNKLSMPFLYVGMVANLVVIMLVIIAVLLIYSLLMISIEKKTFQFGVMRLVGLSSAGLVQLVAAQVLMFVIPAIFSAFVLSIPFLYLTFYFAGNGYETSPIPTNKSCCLAIVVGLLIPSISAIIPIRKALSKNLNEAIYFQRF